MKPDKVEVSAVTVAIEVDRVCTDFDRALRGVETPRIEDLIAPFQSPAREKVLVGLLALEMEHRLGLGQSPALHEYEARFPNDTQLVKAVFSDAVMPANIGRYAVEKVLGKGGFGCVYLAFDRELNRRVAVKVLFESQRSRAAAGHTLLEEARLAASLKHSAIVPVYDVGQDEDGNYYVVLEYVEGTTLKQAIHDGGLKLPEILRLLIVIAEALQFAHERGLTHRDLKPANILLDRERRPYITDFGLAVNETMQKLIAGEVAGTPPYMAPEQAAGENHRVDGRTDIWAFGVMLYEALTGCVPFSGETRDELFYAIRHVNPRPPRQRNAAITSRLETIILTCLAKRMSERYRSAADLLTDLHAAAHELASDAPAVPLAPRNGSPAAGRGDSFGSVSWRVIPKGLRSFQAQDAAFFLRLLPGPRNSEGVPDSIRFWQSRVNETDEDATFSTGLIYGPSGCGKTSFVKAGLLPRLAAHVEPIVVEATRDETELRLIKALRKSFPEIPSALALPEIIGGIREGRWCEQGCKVLLVLDQFEQWLHANPIQEGTQLIDALRQCDGGRVQTLILVRDDFWMQLTRLLRALEVPLVEGDNSAAVDLFDIRHAANVLSEFGIAYGRLPERPELWTDAQRRFMDQAVEGLAVDGRVVPVRLALFVEMVKGRPWTRRMLKEIGGAEGTGIAFLEAAFLSSTAAPEHRLHYKAARAVLECLLPPEATEIKGNMRSEQELLGASGYVRSPAEFRRLIGILDNELRLITPTDPAGQNLDSDDAALTTGERHYQLTHDYLVPAIRAWLTRNRRNTARGRAELRLVERAAAFRAQAHARQLPNLFEWLSIIALTRHRSYEDSERQLLRAAVRHHTRRLAIAATIAVSLSWIAFEGSGRIRAAGCVRSLATAETIDVPKLIEDVETLRRWVDPRLHTMFVEGDKKERLHAAMALLPVDSVGLDYLVDQLTIANVDNVAPIVNVIEKYGDAAVAHQKLWALLEDPKQPASFRLRAAAGLANVQPAKDNRWPLVTRDVFSALLDDLTARPGNFERWLQLLKPIRSHLEPQAATAFQDGSADRQTRYLVAAILASLNQDAVDKLANYAASADADQLRPLQSAIALNGNAAAALLTQIAEQPINDELPESEKDELARRQANASVCLFELGHLELLQGAIVPRNPGDRRLQTWIIECFGRALSSETALRKRLEIALAGLATAQPEVTADAAESRYGWALIVGDLVDHLPRDTFKRRVIEVLEEVYRTDADSGVHSAVEWALRRWGAGEVVERTLKSLSGKSPHEGGGWHVNSAFLTMMTINAPGTITIGSPADEPGREKDEQQRQVVIKEAFEVSSTEVRQEDFIRLMPELKNRYPNDFSAEPSSPANDLTMLDAVRFCRRLSEVEGISEDDMCYPKVEAIGEAFLPDYRRASKSGYRLLSNAEWQHVCRAGSSTPRFYGFAPTLLDRYAWFVENSGGHAHPVGMLKPNRFGLFDIYGNVRELTVYPAALLTKSTISLGGSYSVSSRMLRSANWRADPIGFRGMQNGFRIARTLKSPGKN